MSITVRIRNTLQAARELGPAYVVRFAAYQIGLLSGWFWLQTLPFSYSKEEKLAPSDRALAAFHFAPFLKLPDPAELRRLLDGKEADLVEEAQEICSGMVRLFGGPPVALQLTPTENRHHWTIAEEWLHPESDIKDQWEPARLGWIFTLGRAYRLTADERYADTFWVLLETFLNSNPPNLGLNWASAQEVALRILAMCFGGEVFSASPSSTVDRKRTLWGAIAAHARRIPPTMVYAKAQNNNHLVSEALGLLTAGMVLQSHPKAARWQALGWKWLNKALQTQILEPGEYIQHSTNYHRVMLQAALWAESLNRYSGKTYPAASLAHLADATNWLASWLDPISGNTPNLGHNDGALILPMAQADFRDYRPVLQACAHAFLRQPVFSNGPWDELSAWLNLSSSESSAPLSLDRLDSKDAQRLNKKNSWSRLRVVEYHERPSHADQLSVDLWWNGINLAMDAGTYRYTAPSPWQNALARTRVHNTVEMEGTDQMQYASRFLWLHWAQAKILPEYCATGTITVEHNGYAKFGLVHRRTLSAISTGWRIVDEIIPTQAPTSTLTRRTARLHWLLPDVSWKLAGEKLILGFDPLPVTIQFQATGGSDMQAPSMRIIRAGKVLSGSPGDFSTFGWFSPTYSVKVPALSVQLTAFSTLPFRLVTEFNLPNPESGTI
jgi:hypothetical protein